MSRMTGLWLCKEKGCKPDISIETAGEHTEATGHKVARKIYEEHAVDAPHDAWFLRPAQEEAIVRTMAEPTHAAIWASEMDTGKTLCAAEFIVRMNFRRVLIPGVKDTYAQWAERLWLQSDGGIHLKRIDGSADGQRNLKDCLDGEPGVYFVGVQMMAAQDYRYDELHEILEDGTVGPSVITKMSSKDKTPTGTASFTVTSAGVVTATTKITERVFLGTWRKATRRKRGAFDAIVVDEVHLVANRKSLGLRALKSCVTDWKLGMSGTWLGNRFENAHGLTLWAWPDLIDGNFERWKRDNCEIEIPTKSGGQPIETGRGRVVEIVKGEKEGGKFVESLPCYVRLPDPLGEPPKPEIIHVDLLPEQLEDYDAMVRDSVVWIETHTPGLEPVVANVPPAKRSRLRTLALGTVKWTEDGEIDFPDDTISNRFVPLRSVLDRPDWHGRPVGIYTHSKKFAYVLAKRMNAAGYAATVWSGDVSSKGRDEIKERFLRGEIPYLISVIQAFSTGLDGFQDVCNRLVWVSELDGATDINAQALKRYFRSGNKAMTDDFKHVKIVTRNTIETGILIRNEVSTAKMRDTLDAGRLVSPMAA